MAWLVRALETMIPPPPQPYTHPKRLYFGPARQLQTCKIGSGDDNALNGSSSQLFTLTEASMTRIIQGLSLIYEPPLSGVPKPLAAPPWIHCQLYLVLGDMKLPGPCALAGGKSGSGDSGPEPQGAAHSSSTEQRRPGGLTLSQFQELLTSIS